MLQVNSTFYINGIKQQSAHTSVTRSAIECPEWYVAQVHNHLQNIYHIDMDSGIITKVSYNAV